MGVNRQVLKSQVRLEGARGCTGSPGNAPIKIARSGTRVAGAWCDPGHMGTSLSPHTHPRCPTGSQSGGFDKLAHEWHHPPREVLLCPALSPHATLPPRNITRLQAQLGPHRDSLAEWIEVAATLASATIDPATQRWWAKHVFESLFGRQQCLCANGSVWGCTRLGCPKGPIATGWLCDLPNKALRADIPHGNCRLLLLVAEAADSPARHSLATLLEYPMRKDSLDPQGDHFVCERNCSSQRRNAFWAASFVVYRQHNVAVVK